MAVSCYIYIKEEACKVTTQQSIITMHVWAYYTTYSTAWTNMSSTLTLSSQLIALFI